ncbi:NAD(P)/FAD-dependent oxidoreductase [Pseudonocardia sp. GCM10023141]|uniref:NAD(P)/FAD-dependent oxidoreductase n=1 Tax=Pseudonocardia sp. GCM10023141 TaxID=3252653 RepID=UPI003611B508
MSRGHAMVLGAGIAGLLAARVLADRFATVTVLERDGDSGAAPRRGAPQGAHLHGLLDGGRRLMEELHPGLTAQVVAAGAPQVEPLRDTRWYLHGRRLHPTGTGLVSLLASRPLLESVLRARTVALPGVRFTIGTATGLVAGPGGGVTGVLVREGPTITADLVVDATGRGSRSPDWLAALGHDRPVEQRVDVDLGYATRYYRRRPGDMDGRLGVTVSTVPRSRGGGAIAVEGERWLVTLAGILGDTPPVDPAGFTTFAATLPVPDIHDLIAAAEPLGDPLPYRFRGSRWRRYDGATTVPAGFVAIGDAVCSVNPLYAQGMSLAAQQVRVLQQQLIGPGPLDPRAFHGAAARPCRQAWEIATRADLALPEVAGTRRVPARILDAYVRRVQLVAHRDPAVARAFLRVANLVDAPSRLLTPRLLASVLRPGAT